MLEHDLIFQMCMYVLCTCVYIMRIYGGGRERRNRFKILRVDKLWLTSFFFIFQVVYNKHKLPLNWGDGWI